MRGIEPWTLDRPQLDHGVTIACDDEVFACQHTVHDFPAVIAELSDGHCSHAGTV